jgi:hypothetical protein
MRAIAHGRIAAELALSLFACASTAIAQTVVQADDMIYLGGGVSARAGDLLYTTITPNWRMIAAERFALGMASLVARGLGSDYSKEDLAEKGQIVTGQIPIHGYWVNWEDVFFYTGDTQAFNRFVEAYGKLSHLQLKVVIHAGTTGARSPWDKGDRGPADWSFYRWNVGLPRPGQKPAPSRVDVWIGSKIRLQELNIPANVEVVSGGEIDRFIAARKGAVPQDKPEDPLGAPLLDLPLIPLEAVPTLPSTRKN